MRSQRCPPHIKYIMLSQGRRKSKAQHIVGILRSPVLVQRFLESIRNIYYYQRRRKIPHYKEHMKQKRCFQLCLRQCLERKEYKQAYLNGSRCLENIKYN